MPQALAALAGWTLFAFAGAYRWTVAPVMIAAVVMAALLRFHVLARPHRTLDALLLFCLAGVALQLAPLPAAVRSWLSPSADALDRALRVGGVDDGSFRPLSVDPQATLWALALGATLLLIFWSARGVFEVSGLRRVARGLAWCGLTLAAVVFVQRALSPHLIYGFWAPITRTSVPTPLGPFVNRNDLASWLLLAIPVVLGYAIARLVPPASARRLPSSIESSLDARMAVLAASLVLMTAALVGSLSRSGLAGLAVGLVTLGLLGRRRMDRRGSSAFAAVGIALLVVAAQFTDMAALAYRLHDTLPADMNGRVTIWRETWPMARDFLRSGIGVGAFERGMLVYQQSPRLLFFNHAHNEYLQLLAEGGLLVAVPAALAIAVGVRSALGRLRRDPPPAFWIRAGALGGMAAVAVQSLWDTGLRMPANAVLFAIVAAVAVHVRGNDDPRAGSDSYAARSR